jgi:hypothetical protein
MFLDFYLMMSQNQILIPEKGWHSSYGQVLLSWRGFGSLVLAGLELRNLQISSGHTKKWIMWIMYDYVIMRSTIFEILLS